MTALTRVSTDPFICRGFYHAHVKEMSTPEEKHANQNYRGGNGIPNKVHPMDALTATKAALFVIKIKTIPVLHLTATNPTTADPRSSRPSKFPRSSEISRSTTDKPTAQAQTRRDCTALLYCWRLALFKSKSSHKSLIHIPELKR